jgi:hypothetical protein
VTIADRESRHADTRAALHVGPSQQVLVHMDLPHSVKRPLEPTTAVGERTGQQVSLVVVGPDGDLVRTACEALRRVNGWHNVQDAGRVVGAIRIAARSRKSATANLPRFLAENTWDGEAEVLRSAYSNLIGNSASTRSSR